MSHLIQSVESFSHQGYTAPNTPNHYNEDRLFLGTYSFAVIDGATAITPMDMGGVNTSAYTSKFLAEYLMKHNPKNCSAKATLENACDAFRDHLNEKYPDVIALEKKGPCASVALLKINGNTLTYSNIADSEIAGFKDGAWHILSTQSPRHIELDGQLADYIFNKVAEGMDISQARKCPHFIEMRNRNRGLTNIEFGAFNFEEEMKAFLNEGSCDVSAYEKIAMFSDGFFHPDGKNEKEKIIKAAIGMETLGIKSYHNKLKDMYSTDLDFKQYRRLKHMDDATGIVITFKALK